MSLEPFELEWWGGAAEQHFRRVRPGVEEMPWGTLSPSRYPALLVDRARMSWTEAARNEYATAAAFASVLRELLEVRAPLDLIGMASDFVADEILHVELTSRIAMELGGGAPVEEDFARLTQLPAHEGTAFERVNEHVVRLCCVGEAFSVRMLAGAERTAAHPLTRAVLRRIVQDEAPHGRFGWLYLEWAAERMSAGERERLGAIALDAIRAYTPFWQRLRSTVDPNGRTREGFELAHVHELGWMESTQYGSVARDAILRHVVAPLGARGIEVSTTALGALLD